MDKIDGGIDLFMRPSLPELLKIYCTGQDPKLNV